MFKICFVAYHPPSTAIVTLIATPVSRHFLLSYFSSLSSKNLSFVDFFLSFLLFLLINSQDCAKNLLSCSLSSLRLLLPLLLLLQSPYSLTTQKTKQFKTMYSSSGLYSILFSLQHMFVYYLKREAVNFLTCYPSIVRFFLLFSFEINILLLLAR